MSHQSTVFSSAAYDDVLLGLRLVSAGSASHQPSVVSSQLSFCRRCLLGTSEGSYGEFSVVSRQFQFSWLGDWPGWIQAYIPAVDAYIDSGVGGAYA